ncbi:MAG TPA: LysR family transcriptional regulator [Polyangiales bacterium]|nr:LysR family transcriptional regulator [Polyangiales bacterium]
MLRGLAGGYDLDLDAMKPNPENETLVTDVRDLQALVFAADLRSLSAAAKRMGESIATVSRRIARLESALGVSLLHRSSRGVELTEHGSEYRIRIGAILESLGDANGALRQTHAAPAGQLRISIAPGSDAFLAPMLAKFVREFPEVFVQLLVTERFVDLEAEHIDVALRATRKLADSSLVAHRLLDLELIAIASPDYLREHGTPKRIEELASHRAVQLGELQSPSTYLIQRIDGGDPIEIRVRAAIAVTDLGFAKGLVIAGAGIGLLPRFIMERELDEGRVVHLLRAHVVRGAALYLMHRGGRFLPSKVRAFRDFLLRECRLSRALPRRRRN